MAPVIHAQTVSALPPEVPSAGVACMQYIKGEIVVDAWALGEPMGFVLKKTAW